MFVTPLFLTLLISQAAADEPSFALPVSEGMGVEYYENGDLRFAIFMQKVDWQEAKKLCHSRGGGLIEYLKEVDQQFMGRALAESAVGFASLWIGGEFIPSGEPDVEGTWKWTHSDIAIESQLKNVKKFPMMTSPYWVDRPDNKASTRLCLATDRNMHNDALIVGEPCDKLRPYICKVPPSGNGNGTSGPNPLPPPIDIEGKQFHLFTTPMTWTRALEECRSFGMTLAKVTTEAEFRILNNKMLRVRPVMETAWIGGMVQSGKWVWVGFDEDINVDKTKIIPGMPFPWINPNHIIKEGCLLADRHLCEHLLFVEARCNRNKMYICERDTSKGKKKPPLVVPIPDTDYYISFKGETWEKAQSICRFCLDGDLLQIESTKEGVAKQLPMLYAAMALTLQAEIRHIWLGGYLFKDTFKWTNSSENDPKESDKVLSAKFYNGLQSGGENGRLIFCEMKKRMKPFFKSFKCLNLDRDNQKYFSMYGIKCFYEQHYICTPGHNATLHPSCGTSEFSPPITQGTTATTEEKTSTEMTTTTTEPTTTTTEPTTTTTETTTTTTEKTTTTTEKTTTTTETTTTTTETPTTQTETTAVSDDGLKDLKYFVNRISADYEDSAEYCRKCLFGEPVRIREEDSEEQQKEVLEYIQNTIRINPEQPKDQKWIEGYFTVEKDDIVVSESKEPGLCIGILMSVPGKIIPHEIEVLDCADAYHIICVTSDAQTLPDRCPGVDDPVEPNEELHFFAKNESVPFDEFLKICRTCMKGEPAVLRGSEEDRLGVLEEIINTIDVAKVTVGATGDMRLWREGWFYAGGPSNVKPVPNEDLEYCVNILMVGWRPTPSIEKCSRSNRTLCLVERNSKLPKTCKDTSDEDHHRIELHFFAKNESVPFKEFLKICRTCMKGEPAVVHGSVEDRHGVLVMIDNTIALEQVKVEPTGDMRRWREGWFYAREASDVKPLPNENLGYCVNVKMAVQRLTTTIEMCSRTNHAICVVERNSKLPKTCKDTSDDDHHHNKKQKITKWVSVFSFQHFWINQLMTTYKEAIDSCKKCLNGEIIQILDDKEDQKLQLQMINEALRHTIPTKQSRIWLKSFEFDADTDWEDHPISQIAVYDRLKDTFNPMPRYNKKVHDKNKCPALNFRRNNTHIIEDNCGFKRHTICGTRHWDTEQDPSCTFRKGDYPDDEESEDDPDNF